MVLYTPGAYFYFLEKAVSEKEETTSRLLSE